MRKRREYGGTTRRRGNGDRRTNGTVEGGSVSRVNWGPGGCAIMMSLFNDVELDVGAVGDFVGHGEVAAAVCVSLKSGVLSVEGAVSRAREGCVRKVGAVQVAQCSVTALGLVVVVAVQAACILVIVVLTSHRCGCVCIYKAVVDQLSLQWIQRLRLKAHSRLKHA